MAASMMRYIGRFSVLPCTHGLGSKGGLYSNRRVENSWRMLSSLCNRSYGSRRTNLYQCFETRINSATSLRYTHTSGDKAMVEFLKDEIKLEKQNEQAGGKLPRMKGFELTTAEGPNVVLTRKSDNETITIKLNVNHAVDESVSDIDESNPQGEEKHPQMLCKPSFVVEINKGGGDRTLAIQCVFPHPDDLPPPDQQDQQYEDLIEIQEVAVLNTMQEWTDDVYSLAGGLMDGNLYDMLLKLLEERGITADLIQQLVEFCTAYEHKKYVNLLEQLQEFAASK